MENEERILKGIEELKAQMAPVTGTARSMESLRRDLAPRVEEAVRVLITELADVESDFQLEDLLGLVKKSMRNVRTLSTALDQLSSLLKLADNLEPLVRQSVPVWITALDEMERKGVFTLLKGLLGVMEKAGAAYGEEDIGRMGDGLVTLMGLARALGEPGARELLERLAGVPARVRLGEVREAGAWDLLTAMRDPSVKRGLGLVIELTRALGEVTPGRA